MRQGNGDVVGELIKDLIERTGGGEGSKFLKTFLFYHFRLVLHSLLHPLDGYSGSGALRRRLGQSGRAIIISTTYVNTARACHCGLAGRRCGETKRSVRLLSRQIVSCMVLSGTGVYG